MEKFKAITQMITNFTMSKISISHETFASNSDITNNYYVKNSDITNNFPKNREELVQCRAKDFP